MRFPSPPPGHAARGTLIALLAALAVIGCTTDSTNSSGPGTPTPAASGPTLIPTDPAATSDGSLPTQTDTEWGRIWDTVPAAFPVFPGATPAEDASGEPASARFAVEGGDPQAIATWLQDALEQATFSTLGLNGPGEDGGFVLDSTGEGDCRLQTTIAPLGGVTFVTVLYGAACPSP